MPQSESRKVTQEEFRPVKDDLERLTARVLTRDDLAAFEERVNARIDARIAELTKLVQDGHAALVSAVQRLIAQR